MIFGVNTTRDISKLSNLRITILKYHAWYLCQISLQIMLLPILIITITITIIIIMDSWSSAFCDWLRRTCSCDDTWLPAQIVYLGEYRGH